MIFRMFMCVVFFGSSAVSVAKVQSSESAVPADLINLKTKAPQIIIDLQYAKEKNFLARKVRGYHGNNCYLTKHAAEALAKVQSDLEKMSYSLKVLDCTRPQRAVDDMVVWSQDLNDQKTKHVYYPNIEKSQLFRLGYIAKKSGHSRGSTVDITFVKVTKKVPVDVDMGSPFDFFDVQSHTDFSDLTAKQKQNRELLKSAMERHHFKNYAKEWWHYTLEGEPFPSTIFDFDIR